MRVLVHGPSLGGIGRRLAMAACGLASRGHEVLWVRGRGGAATGPASGAQRTGPAMARYEADVVLGGPAPVVVALSGWWVRARCLVLAVDPASLRGWGLTARWAWETVHAWGVLDEADAAALQAAPRGLDLDRIALWPAGGPPGGPDSSHADTEVLERLCERALARQRSRARRAAVFVDRDGTLVVERGYLSDPADLELLPGAARALRQLKAGGFPVLVISNQSGVGRGLFPRTRVHEAMARLREQLRAEGVELDGIYFCPHRPEEGCSCRKPGTGLLEQAAEDQHLTLRASFMVGDKLLDVETGQRAGGLGVLVRSGYGREEERLLARGGSGLVPDLVCDDLEQAAHWILAQADPAGFG